MAGRLQGKGRLHHRGGARGRGRSHAIRLAHKGADIIAVEPWEAVPSVNRSYPE